LQLGEQCPTLELACAQVGGFGARLFDDAANDRNLSHQKTMATPSQFTLFALADGPNCAFFVRLERDFCLLTR
jgi:hypothetical protein